MSHGPILQGDVLRFAETGRHVRVVWIEQPADLLVVFDLEGDEGFSRASFRGTEAMIAAGSVEPVFEHGFDAPIRPGPISEKRADRGKVLMKAIEPLLAMGVELFDDRKRGSAVMRAAADGPDRKTLHAALDRYFRHGMTPAAVIPGFLNCGAPNRKKRRGLVKLGRPRRLGKRPGTNVTPEIEKIFELGIRRYYGRNGRISLAKARVLMLTELCMERRIDPDTRRIVYTAKPLYEEEDFPTIRQLSYWFKENADIFAIKRERTGRKSYDRNLRGITGSAQSHVRGPGSRYEIDATIINIYVVSELEDGLIIGRPVLYVVVDVFSKMIVGFYIGLEGPSWVGAMMALVSVVENKREFCARYGVIIGDGEWPCEFLPEALLGDRGEIASRIIEMLQQRHNVIVENAQSHRPDWKGTVEKRFDLIDVEYRPFVSGYVAPDFGERGVRDPRLDAIWTISDLYRTMIPLILHFNNRHKLVDYPRDGAMIRDGVRAIPAELWEWGIATRQGRMRRASVDAVKFAVMPTDTCTVRHKGIYFRGLYYTCDRAEVEDWFAHARQTRWSSKPMSYDLRSVRHIYLHDDSAPEGYVVCKLLPQFECYENLSFTEVAAIMASDKADTADRSVEDVTSQADVAAMMQETERAARERGKAFRSRRPKDVKGIRENHAGEKAERRRDEAFDLGEGRANGGNVHQLPMPSRHDRNDDDDGAEPTLSQLLKRKDDTR
ncbi:transposase family protein [Sphingomonas sp. IC-56]|uniref:transposase family protein n=1 Tax=Sphingomonas sp. IC-56 TaxID=2898529 RepID=UPI001E451BB1|nr:transposase family protein [Sphingomonas sp. IC-56]MCD2322514.1 transposase family protein [Sphingomonas sp. IC-56]